MLHIEAAGAFRPSGGSWSALEVVDDGGVDVGPNGLTIAALTDQGDSAITFLDSDTTHRTVSIALGDGADPVIDSLSVPGTGKVGQARERQR